MPLLKPADILANRASKLKVNSAIPPVAIALNHAQPKTSVTTVATPPGKKIFSIVAWNVQDYKDKKMSNPFVNDFVRLVADKLSVDLLILIETDFDLTELVSNIEGVDASDFGGLLIKPPAAPKDEDWSDITDPVKQKAHLEAMAQAMPQFNLFASTVAHRRVDPPVQFTAADLQKDKFKPGSADFGEWIEMLEALRPCYTLTDNNGKFATNDYSAVIAHAKKHPHDFVNNLADDICFDLITVCAACKGVAASSTNCQWCFGTGKYLNADCAGCGGAGKVALVCNACGGTGDYSIDSETRVLETLREIVQRKKVPGVDTETYTMLWRKSDAEVASRFTVNNLPAADSKAVWLNPQGCGLVSVDANGKELGYQNPNSKFNGRCPFVIPLQMTFNRKKYFVPLAVLHSIWGITKAKKNATQLEKQQVKISNKNAEEGRVESVLKLLDLAILNGAETVAVRSTHNFVLLGDLNLNYKPTSKRGYDAEAYKKIRNATGNSADLILPIIGGTKSSLTLLETAFKKNLKDSYTNAYDQFLLAESSEVYQNTITGGVIDVLAILEDELSTNAALQKSVDADIKAQTKDDGKTPFFDLKGKTLDNKFRAFYVYRKYVSDHLPIILDVLVDETDAEEKQKVELQKQLSLIVPAPPDAPLQYYGVCQKLTATAATADAVNAIDNNTLVVTGQITKIVFPDWVEIEAAGAKRHSFQIKADAKAVNLQDLRIGHRAQATIALAQQPQQTMVNAVFINGTWSSLQTTEKTVYRYKPATDQKTGAVRGTVVALLAPNRINIEIPYKNEQRRIFQGAVSGANFAALKIGDWLEGVFVFA